MNPTRELPISLQGIETILLFLNERDKMSSSIRSVSENTGLSMRVVKNVLLQLERFNQVERMIEKNNILPKWRITKFGKRVLKEAKGIENNIKFPSREEELIHNITIPKDKEELKNLFKRNLELISTRLNTVQSQLSRTLGPILDVNNPVFEDLMGFIITRIKYLSSQISNIPKDPTLALKMIKYGEKKPQISLKEGQFLFGELNFYLFLILNELNRVLDFISNLSQNIENKAFSEAYSIATDIRDEIRILSDLIIQMREIDIKTHKLTQDDVKKILNKKIDLGILDNIIDIPLTKEIIITSIKDVVLDILAKLNKGERKLVSHSVIITDNFPIFALYDFILDEKPYLNFSIEDFERAINSLADEGYIPGIRILQEDEEHYLKIIQLKQHDISEDEINLVSFAVRYQKFTLADLIEEKKWSSEKSMKLLNRLTDLGILKHSKSLLHGEQWYVVSNL
ncbi:MAG: hypothetical protein ACW98X_05090 [Promethearchaeota archaeon]|jgi:hypothetical protein